MTPEETKAAAEVMLAYAEGKKVECKERCCGEDGWVLKEDHHWAWNCCEYRIAIEKPSINWDHVAPEFNYMAVDLNGDVCFYTRKPELFSYKWGRGQDWCAMQGFASYKRGTCDWKDSLIIRPGYEEE